MRDRILRAAARQFVEHGLQSSMNSIAKEAGVATGSLYNYFPSKEDLVLGVCDSLARSMERALVSEVDFNVDYKVRVRSYISSYIDLIWEDPDRAILYDYVSNNPAIVGDAFHGIFRIVTEYSVYVFSLNSVDAPQRIPPHFVGSFVRGAIRNTLKKYRLSGQPLTEQEKACIITMCCNAVDGVANMIGPE